MIHIIRFAFLFRGALFPLALLPAILMPVEPRAFPHYFAGFALLSAGVVLRISGIRHLGGKAHVHSAKARGHGLTVSGVYGHTRNPLYLGNILSLLGLQTLFIGLAPLLPGGCCLFALYTLVVYHEERALEAQLETAYSQYRSAVPRWFFRWRPYRLEGANEKPLIPWSQVFHLEHAFLGVTMIGGATAPLLPRLDIRYGLGPNGTAILATALVLTCTLLFARISIKIKRKERFLQPSSKAILDEVK